MALIDEYKQAIKDVLDGRAPKAPRPSELPETEDKLATLYAAAAAEVMAEAKIPEAVPPVLYVSYGSVSINLTPFQVFEAIQAGRGIVLNKDSEYCPMTYVSLGTSPYDIKFMYDDNGTISYYTYRASSYSNKYVLQ